MPLNPDQFGLFQSPNPPRASNRGPLQASYSDTVKSGGKGTSQHLSDIDRVLAESSPTGEKRTAFPGWEEGAADFDRAEAELKDKGRLPMEPLQLEPGEVTFPYSGEMTMRMITGQMQKNVYRDVVNSGQPLTSPRQLETGTQGNRETFNQLDHLISESAWPEGFEISQSEYKQNRQASHNVLRSDSGSERTQVFINHADERSLNDLEALDWQLENIGHAKAPYEYDQTVGDHHDYKPNVAVLRGLKSLYESRPEETDPLVPLSSGDPDVEAALDRGYQTVFPEENFMRHSRVPIETVQGLWQQLQQRGEKRKQGDGGNQ
jgi:hypothetical protein